MRRRGSSRKGMRRPGPGPAPRYPLNKRQKTREREERLAERKRFGRKEKGVIPLSPLMSNRRQIPGLIRILPKGKGKSRGRTSYTHQDGALKKVKSKPSLLLREQRPLELENQRKET